MIGFAAHCLMELEVEGVTGASHGERSPLRINCQSALDRDPRSACKRGSDAILVKLRLFRTDQSGLKQIDFAAAIHLTSDELEARDLTLSLSVGPGRSNCRSNRRFIPRDAAG